MTSTNIRSHKQRGVRQHIPKLLILPTVLLSLIFVYGFIVFTALMSTSNWAGYTPDLSQATPWYSVYQEMFATQRFQSDIRNMIVFTVVFLVMSVFAGLGLAMLVHRVTVASGFFRNFFLFPYALSFIVTGVIWRWMFDPAYGINMLLKFTGVGSAIESATGHEFTPQWISDPTVVGSLNGVLTQIFPWAGGIQTQLGIPLALIAVAFAACWQFAGFSMAFFLAALGGIPQDTLEAAGIDGASWWQTQRYIVLPFIRPAISAVVIILLIASLQIFDLIVAMGGSGPNFVRDVPGLYVYDYMFKALRQNTGAAASIVMLVVMSIFAIPYLWRSLINNRSIEE